MTRAPDHDGKVDDLNRLIEELDLGLIEAVEDLDEDALERLTRELGGREELERVWDLMRGIEDSGR